MDIASRTKLYDVPPKARSLLKDSVVSRRLAYQRKPPVR
jgi:hypothetical protein